MISTDSPRRKARSNLASIRSQRNAQLSRTPKVRTRGVTIRRFAVVSTSSVILPGISIGEHALVGAMSLVTRDVEPETVVVGVPAKSRGSVRDIKCVHGALDNVYPWPIQFRRGYTEGALPEPETFT